MASAVSEFIVEALALTSLRLLVASETLSIVCETMLLVNEGHAGALQEATSWLHTSINTACLNLRSLPSSSALTFSTSASNLSSRNGSTGAILDDFRGIKHFVNCS